MSNEIRRLPPKPGQMQINQKQGSLALEIDKQTEIQGIGMGVLKDGTPFLNQRGFPTPMRLVLRSRRGLPLTRLLQRS
jgi:hypothetical protein